MLTHTILVLTHTVIVLTNTIIVLTHTIIVLTNTSVVLTNSGGLIAQEVIELVLGVGARKRHILLYCRMTGLKC